MSLRPGDEILLWDQEYPSHLYPWKTAADRSGAVLKLVRSGPIFSTPVEQLLESITPQTKVISISWVQFQSGAVTELAPLVEQVRKKGDIWIVLDVIQGVGQFPFDFEKSGVDAICGGSHKWLTSPVGVGYLAIRPERVQALRPIQIGAYTYGTCEDPADLACIPKTDALKFEAGSKQVLEILALGASVKLMHQTGMDVISSEAYRLAEILRNGLTERGYEILNSNGPKSRGAIVTFKARDKTELILKDHKVSYAIRGGGIRLSPHAWNRDEHIERVLKWL
jgi:selenocysteine lyase/cysteine desulfurase